MKPPRLRPIVCSSVLALLVLCVATISAAPPRTAPPAGLRENTPTVHALVNARIVVSPEQTIDKGTLVVRDGVIVAVGEKVEPPADARRLGRAGQDALSGLDRRLRRAVGATPPHAALERRAAAPAIGTRTSCRKFRADRLYATDAAANKKLRRQGITARLVAPSAGIIKGTSALVSTADDGGKQVILKDQVALHLKLTTRAARLGAAIPIRRWAPTRSCGRRSTTPAGTARPGTPSRSIPNWHGPSAATRWPCSRGYLGRKPPVVIDAADELYFLRADRIADEFDLNAIVRGSGDEYRRLRRDQGHRPRR